MSRLAFLSPLPPAATGIADYSAELLALLAPLHHLDVYHAQPEVERTRLPAACGVWPAAELLTRHAERAYDLVIYQLGNGPDHAFQYPLMTRLPGLLVLHDLVLHHARALVHLDSDAARAYAHDPSSQALRQAALGGLQAYTDELRQAYPRQAERLAAVQLGSVGRLLPYAYPLFRQPVAAARLTAVHNGCMARAIEDEVPAARVARVSMPIRTQALPAGAVAALRARLLLGPDDFVVGSFGLLTREKQIATVARAVARAVPHLPRLRLLLVGAVPDRARLDRLLADSGIAERSVITGRVAFTELAAHIEAVDVAVHLRYPTARETSAALLRLLAQGRPTVMSDLENFAEIPEDAVWRADPTDEEGEVTRALLRLAASPGTRDRLGRAAAAHVAQAHSDERCLESYQAAIAAAIGQGAGG